MAKRTNGPVYWIVVLIICLPAAIFLLLKLCVRGVASLFSTASNEANAYNNAHGNKRQSGRGKRITLYEALRLPGDPDPEFGGCSIYIDSEKSYASSRSEVFNDEEDIKSEADEADELGIALGTLALYNLLSEDDDETDDGYEDDDGFSWETHCEYCGELLEDCVCEHRRQSREDIGLFDNEEDDEGFFSSERDDRSCDFDEFRSF